MENTENNIMTDYISSINERLEREPMMTIIESSKFFDKKDDIIMYIIVQNTPENIKKFNDYVGNADTPHNVKVYYNDPDDYDFIIDGLLARAELKKQRKRQEALDNPQVWQNVKDIGTKDELIEYLIGYWRSTNRANIWEYSSDSEVDDKEFEVTAKELDKKIKEFL